MKVTIPGGLSSVVSDISDTKRGRRNALTVGAASGWPRPSIPIAAITFVLEELVGDLSNRYLGSVVLAWCGALVVQASLGPQPAFSLTVLSDTSWQLYLIVPSSPCLRLQQHHFEKAALYLRDAWRRSAKWPLDPAVWAAC